MYQEVAEVMKGKEGRDLDFFATHPCRLEVVAVRQSLDMLL
jgi:hypothetical protein